MATAAGGGRWAVGDGRWGGGDGDGVTMVTV